MAMPLLWVLIYFRVPSELLDESGEGEDRVGGFNGCAASCGVHGDVAVLQKKPCAFSAPSLPAVTACPSSWNVHPLNLCPNGCVSLCVYTDMHTSSSQHKYIFKIYCSGKPSE